PDTKELGDVLVEEGLITSDQLVTATEEQQRVGRSLGRVLIDLGMVREPDLVSVLARQIGLEFVDLGDYQIDPQAAGLVSDQVARRYRALPIGFDDGRLVVAMSDPANVFALDDIRTITGMDVKPVVATAADIENAVRKYGHFDQSVEEIASEASAASEDTPKDLAEIGAAVEDAPIVKLVNMLINQAVSERASDIHIEPAERDIRIRYRIDGVLHEVMRSPKNIQAGLISRLKVMADMNIAERRVPQDGRVGLVVAGKPIDLRMASLPTVYGEKVVMRILDKTSVLIKLEDLGFSDHAYKKYEEGFRKPYGTILVTGPTGSGKSTTLYATLNIINSADRNILTVEDPVEYRLPGVNQMQVNNKAGLTFASALRSMLRADPDVILIGEIRDRETALIAMEAALTGHLVLSTLHTNDAASAITRLSEMDVEPFLVASAVDCVVAQRLGRKLCDNCKEPYEPTDAELDAAGFPEDSWSEIDVLYRAQGCTRCSKTGFKGRMGLYEIMLMTEDIERMTAERRSSEDIRRMAIEQGMVTLRGDGLGKARAGVTSLDEIFRVVV
ncbi:MAG: Flp pilus assembly complex ATPase component TadA, partial [Actinomycetota bacterium]|nr:Flp pilus assembly complex ATPase component TadA [Actinomycetota bacterium]